MLIYYATVLQQTSICFVEGKHRQVDLPILSSYRGQVLQKLEGPNPAHPGNFWAGLGPISLWSTCLAYPPYRETSQGILGACVSKQGKLAFTHLWRYIPKTPTLISLLKKRHLGAHLLKQKNFRISPFTEMPPCEAHKLGSVPPTLCQGMGQHGSWNRGMGQFGSQAFPYLCVKHGWCRTQSWSQHGGMGCWELPSSCTALYLLVGTCAKLLHLDTQVPTRSCREAREDNRLMQDKGWHVFCSLK